jgi:transposase InsO family protein
VRFAFIDAEKAQWPVDVQCETLGVSRSGYYAWKGRPEAPRAAEDAELVDAIKAAHEASRATYGSPRAHRELRAKGRRVGRKRVERLMRQQGIVVDRSLCTLSLSARNPESAVVPENPRRATGALAAVA